LIHALQKVKAAGYDFQCVIGGQGPLSLQLEKLIVELALSGYVSLAGYVPADMVPIMYGAADAFVLPTAELECFGLIIIEALACGRPVLATPVGAIPEALKQFEPKWLAANSSIGAIAELIISYLKGALPIHSPSELRKQVASMYSREYVLAELVNTAFGSTR
jgi:glycosyltransferase involved in cell wall biosynthesis